MLVFVDFFVTFPEAFRDSGEVLSRQRRQHSVKGFIGVPGSPVIVTSCDPVYS